MKFLSYYKLCLKRSWNETIRFMEWDFKRIISAIFPAIVGFILVFKLNGSLEAKNKFADLFLNVIVPLFVFSASMFVINFFRCFYLIYKEQNLIILAKEKELEALKGQKQSVKDEMFFSKYCAFLQAKIQQAEALRNQQQYMTNVFVLDVLKWQDSIYGALCISIGELEANKLNEVYNLGELPKNNRDTGNDLQIPACRKALAVYEKHLSKLKDRVRKLNFLDGFELSKLDEFLKY